MTSERDRILQKTWRRDSYIISTDPALIPISELNEAFGSDILHWATALPDRIMRETIDNSLCFGLYRVDDAEDQMENDLKSLKRTLVGFARCITDFTTFLFLTDVYVDPGCQGGGLGGWLVGCVREVIESIPHLRRSMLITSDWERSVPFYEKTMGMNIFECKRSADGTSQKGAAIMQKRGPAFPDSIG